MKAIRVHQFGGLDALVYEDVPRPTPGEGEVLVRVKAAGVGPWDALIRRGESGLHQPLPLTLGSDLSGVVEEVGPNAFPFQPGDEVFGATNPMFTGGYAEYAVVKAGMIAHKPKRLSDIEAASVPVVAVTARQMLFEHGNVDSAKRVLVLGAAGSVGAYAVQMAKEASAEVAATAFAKDKDYVHSLGADLVLDAATEGFEERLRDIDVVLDMVGGETQAQAFTVLKPGGTLVSVVSSPNPELAARYGVQGVFFYVAVTSERLTVIADLLQAGKLTPCVGEVLPLAHAREAHEMLAGKPHERGKIVLAIHREV